jgi:hypothetical protein
VLRHNPDRDKQADGLRGHNPHFIAAVGLLTALHLCNSQRGQKGAQSRELQPMYWSQIRRLNAEEREKLRRHERSLYEKYPLGADQEERFVKTAAAGCR